MKQKKIFSEVKLKSSSKKENKKKVKQSFFFLKKATFLEKEF